jgi:hypothetical protein
MPPGLLDHANRVCLVLFDMENRTFGPYLACVCLRQEAGVERCGPKGLVVKRNEV